MLDVDRLLNEGGAMRAPWPAPEWTMVPPARFAVTVERADGTVIRVETTTLDEASLTALPGEDGLTVFGRRARPGRQAPAPSRSHVITATAVRVRDFTVTVTEAARPVHEWERDYPLLAGCVVIDPDGWLEEGAPAWDENITLDEYRRRAGSSTSNHNPDVRARLAMPGWFLRLADLRASEAELDAGNRGVDDSPGDTP